MSQITLSIVSHGHGALVHALLRDLDGLGEGAPRRVILTLNLADEPFDPNPYRNLRISVVRNAVPRGFGANHNQAFRLCETPWFGVLNPDLRLAHGSPFPALLQTARLVGRIGAVAPRIVDSGGTAEDAVRANLTPWALARRHVAGQRLPVASSVPARPGTPFYWLAGMFLLLDSQAFREVGGFDTRFFMYCEDYDLCARLFGAGYALAVSSAAAVVHDARRDSHRSRQHLRWHVESLAKVWLSRAFWRVTLGLPARRLTSRA